MNFNYQAAKEFLQRKEETRQEEIDILFKQAWKDFNCNCRDDYQEI